MAPTSLTNLPTELLILVLSQLDPLSTFRCMSVCRSLNLTLASSPYLRYNTQLQMSGMWDNTSPLCPHSIHDRLDMLKERERSWRNFDYKWATSVEVPTQGTDGIEKWSGTYDLTPSVYLTGRAHEHVHAGPGSAHAIQALRMPWAAAPDEVEWHEFNFGMQIFDFCTAIEEHDLLACVSCVQDELNPSLIYYIVILLRFSTKRIHDGCKRYVLAICSADQADGIPNISIEVAGENLAVICFFPDGFPAERGSATNNRLHIFDWQKGTRKGDSIPVYNIGLTFLREDVLLQPNTYHESLDVYHVPPSSESLEPPDRILSLSLPTLLPNHRYTLMSCRSDPNPSAGGLFPSSTRKERPFANNPKDAIAIFAMSVQEGRDDELNVSRKRFVMIAHRKSLLDFVVDSLPSSSVSTMSCNQWQHTPYSAWGPPITRWFAANDFSTGFITTTSGQRCVQYVPRERVRRGLTAPAEAMEEDEDTALEPDTIQILDFNPWNVKLTRHIGDLLGVGGGLLGVVGGLGPSSAGGKNFKEHPSNILAAGNTFEEPVVGRLPYVVSASDEKWDYDAVLLDEERVVGIRHQPDAHTNATIDLIYFG